ncbi:MAG: prepilin-type N-terminal cleavage/methylation domain-containing protein [Alphaproteobacteria bacterium]|nr:prepilin-type N-terminal cleavage/methylation domain-containing protein [Alphaproteobacteria bacterium]
MEKAQSGRSMIEMLGVLAIIGVLSVGALAGYSAAMAKYKTNQAITEINEYILGIKELYSNRHGYDDITNNILISAQIFPADSKSKTFNDSILVEKSSHQINHFILSYALTDETQCQRIITAGWENDFGHDVKVVQVYNGTWHCFVWEGAPCTEGGAENILLPVTIDKTAEICENVSMIGFHVK